MQVIAKQEPNLFKLVRNLVLGIGSLLVIVIAGCSSCTTIPSGQVGVVSVWGRIQPQYLSDGMHFINPIAVVNKANIQTATIEEKADVITGQNEGLTVGVEATLLYHLAPASVTAVYKNLGSAYESKIVEPTFHSVIREVMANYVSADLYGAKRTTIQAQIDNNVHQQLESRGFVVESVLLKTIVLPPSVTASIEKKQTQQQEAEAMTYVLQKAQQEADRKRIEAQGIKDFQTIVSQGISEPLLKWKGIEATEKLADSPNAKIVIVGSGKDGLPIILGGDGK